MYDHYFFLYWDKSLLTLSSINQFSPVSIQEGFGTLSSSNPHFSTAMILPRSHSFIQQILTSWLYLVSVLLCLSIRWPGSSPTVVAAATRLFPSSHSLPVTLLTQGTGAPLECWSDPFPGTKTCPPLSLALLWGEFLERPLFYLSIPLAPQEPQHSSVFSSLDPPSFLPILTTSASLVLPMEAQLNHLPFVGKRQHQPAERLRSGGHLGRIMPDFSRVDL